ncbi:DEAD/DEAH box helicase [Sphingobium subterraneum]|uniref:DEAD-box ATP-dependent RNA helicase RhpA n=1 Tax=Sphingobium subterraneum TaxID=627688 RepID=A0A841J3N1_9SPHN|nr:DEAD/DEAH box helicase [Sphingobium subterraneum]MBB6123205.1 ATP-dependent RNA helicase RhlE [Sphingobium subterraneum]
MQFQDLGLAEPIIRALAAKNYDTPTPIQAQAIPPLLEGRDLCGVAQTGTGKTAAFALPSLDYFHRNPKHTPLHSTRMLILSPTRELAAQIADSFRDYARFMRLTIATVFGGVPINKQIRGLQAGVDILVATPGRLIDLIEQRAFHLGGVEIFVLDEADQMMDMGFIQPLKRLVKMLPKERQNLFFSATMPKEIAELGSQFLNDPVRVSVAPQSTTAERVQQYATFVNQAEKQALLTHTVKTEEIDRALIFTRTKHGADRVVRYLEGAGIAAVAIHGNKSQAQRTAALQAFRHGHVKLLVATDIAARGIDVSGVSHVINFELPNVAEQYVHRIGRTARAGADGIAVSFVADDERPFLRAIERITRVKCEVVPLPENFAEIQRNLPKPAPDRRGARPGPRGDGRRADQGRGARPERGSPDRAHRPDRPQGERPQGDRVHAERPRGERPARAAGQGAPGAGAGEGARRPFRPRGKGGVGQHQGAVRKFEGR